MKRFFYVYIDLEKKIQIFVYVKNDFLNLSRLPSLEKTNSMSYNNFLMI